MAKYGLIGKALSKGVIIGFFLVDNTGKQILISKEKALQIAEKGLVTNWEVVTDDDGNKYLYSQDLSLEKIPNMVKEDSTDLKPVGRLTKDGKLVGYSCIDSNKVKHNYTSDKFWQMVKIGLIKDVKAKKHNSKRILESTDRFLEKLPMIETN